MIETAITGRELQMLQAMANAKLGNYAGIPGLTSSLIGGSTYGKVRLFECSRNHQENIVPHSHRFDVLCLVLRGSVKNHIWQCGVGDQFTASTFKYLDAPGHLMFSGQAEPARYYPETSVYAAGELYSMRASHVHSIEFSRDAVVLFFEGPELTKFTTILQPFVDGKTVPTFQVQPWMYQREEAAA